MKDLNIKEIVAGIKDLLSWSAPLLPVPLGYVLLAIGLVLAAGYLIGKWRGK